MPNQASPTPDVLVDFYAAVLAAAVVVLFAKFMTHHGRPRICSVPAAIFHLVCVVAAWLSLVMSLAVLGHVRLPRNLSWVGSMLGGWPNDLAPVRGRVFLAVLLASSILAVDVAVASSERGSVPVRSKIRSALGAGGAPKVDRGQPGRRRSLR
jgi:predicted PurR-regulated permease PerM